MLILIQIWQQDEGSPIIRVKDEIAMEIASIKAGKGQTIAWEIKIVRL